MAQTAFALLSQFISKKVFRLSQLPVATRPEEKDEF